MIGGFRYQIELLARSAAPDEAGGVAALYAPTISVWAAVDLLPTIGVVSGDRGRRVRRVKAMVRNRSDFEIGGRIRFDGVDYEITSIESDDERGRRVFLIGEEALS